MKRLALVALVCLAACTPASPSPSEGSSSSAANSSATVSSAASTATVTSSAKAQPSNAYIGLTVAAAQAKAKAEGTAFRVVMLDGEAQPVTLDYRPGRLNASVENGKVVKIDIEGQEQEASSSVSYDQNSWKTMIPATCSSFYDGCNSCTRVGDGAACTKMACQTYQKPECRD